MRFAWFCALMNFVAWSLGEAWSDKEVRLLWIRRSLKNEALLEMST